MIFKKYYLDFDKCPAFDFSKEKKIMNDIKNKIPNFGHELILEIQIPKFLFIVEKNPKFQLCCFIFKSRGCLI